MNAPPVVLLKFAGVFALALLPGPRIAWAVLLCGWFYAVEMMWHRRFGGSSYPPIVRALQLGGLAIFLTWRIPILVFLAAQAMWDVLIEMVWDQQFPWG